MIYLNRLRNIIKIRLNNVLKMLIIFKNNIINLKSNNTIYIVKILIFKNHI